MALVLRSPKVAIVDHGLGNLFSVKHACQAVGLYGLITDSPEEIVDASAVILPGVGAFARAMASLADKNLIAVIRDFAASGKPLLGICLGMQLFMSESYEFGRHEGLNLINGGVRRLDVTEENGRILKVPHMGWNRIQPPSPCLNDKEIGEEHEAWRNSLLAQVPPGSQMYFVHSYYVDPEDSIVVRSLTRYGRTTFCSSLNKGNIWGFQFHPERSGSLGLSVYSALAKKILLNTEGKK